MFVNVMGELVERLIDPAVRAFPELEADAAALWLRAWITPSQREPLRGFDQ